MTITSRRTFLGGIGTTLGDAAVGFAVADRAGFAETFARLAPERLRFGPLDPLVDLLQGTPADDLLPKLVGRLRCGTTLSDLVAAGALANARGHGGTDYNGYHVLMALMPGHEMAAQMPPRSKGGTRHQDVVLDPGIPVRLVLTKKVGRAFDGAPTRIQEPPLTGVAACLAANPSAWCHCSVS